ncbi:MAG TPA: acetyltransferase [Parvularculaceae bacterium]|nr:acetyltransferase [Parvularculaceae bacterium]
MSDDIERGDNADRTALLAIWEASVRASHDFLEESDIDSLRPVVRDVALAKLELWVAKAERDAIAGFMGLDGAHVEALFIDPPFQGRGFGRRLLDHARALKGPLLVDVNEQNALALSFYLKYGFEIVARSSTDSDGRPFPLLHLAMPGALPTEE